MSFQTGGNESIYKRDKKKWAVGSIYRVKGGHLNDTHSTTGQLSTRESEERRGGGGVGGEKRNYLANLGTTLNPPLHISHTVGTIYI